MDDKRTLWKAVSSSHRSLLVEYTFYHAQKGLLYAVLSTMCIYLLSRFFVLLHYDKVAMIIGGVLFFTQLCYSLLKAPLKKDALHQLDAYYPHNELLTVLTSKEDSPLIQHLQRDAEKSLGEVKRNFSKRTRNWWQPKVLLMTALSFIFLLLLIAFPSDTQREAQSLEEERLIVKDVKEKLEKEPVEKLPEEAKKKLDELLKAVEDAKTNDELLKELIKTQKELEKLEQEIALKEQDEQTKAQLEALQSVNANLAANAQNAMKQLSELGKPLDLAMQKTIANMNKDLNDLRGTNALNNQSQGSSDSSSEQSGDGTESGEASGNGGTSSNQGGGSQGSSQNQGIGSGQQGQNGAGGQGSNGQNAGQNGNQGSQGNGQGSGQGNGSGNSQGTGQGNNGGLLGGTGSGGRDLVAVPERIGQAGAPTVDSGTISDGETITDRGPVPTTKGTVKAYDEVIGAYRDSYRESTERLQLPSDLQQMIQTYFTSIEQ